MIENKLFAERWDGNKQEGTAKPNPFGGGERKEDSYPNVFFGTCFYTLRTSNRSGVE